MKNVKEMIEEINDKEIAKHENKFENITKKEEENVDKICEEKHKNEEKDAPKKIQKVQEE